MPPADCRNTTGQIEPHIHGTSGPVQISVQGFLADLDSRVLKAASQLKHEFPFNIDVNSGNPLGIGRVFHHRISISVIILPGWNQFAIGGGRRTSAATAYLRPVLSRPNLDVLINTQVTKVLQTSTKKGVPVFRGVQFARSATGKYLCGSSLFPCRLPSNQVHYTPLPQLRKLSCQLAL